MRPESLDPQGWTNIAAFLAPAVALQNEVNGMDLMREVARGEAQLWGIVDDITQEPKGAMITQIVEFQSGLRACVVRMAGTAETNVDWESMRSVIQTVEYFAVDNHCDVVRVPGRRGWGRVFSDYEVAYVVHEKRLGEAN